MRYLFCKNNRLKALPPLYDNCNLISCVLYSNQLEELPSNFLRKGSSALGSLTMLEELNLSSNELTTLSSSIFDLPALQILKAHSNRIKAIPDLSVSPTLQTVDISNNALGAHTSSIATGPALKQLDLTCNPALNLNSGTLRRTHKKPVALYDIGAQSQDRVQVGFSETSGNRNKLCIRRVHCGDIFGMVDGSSNYELPKTIQTILNQLLLNSEHHNNLPANLLKAHESLEEAGERLGAMMTGGHLEKITETGELDEDEYDRIRSAGGTVDECNIINGVTPNCHQLGFYSLHPVITPRSINKSIPITRDTDCVIIASWAMWEYLNSTQIASILTSSINPQVAAKAIQDSLQACDYNGNSCIIVIRLMKPELAFRSEPSPPSFLPMVPPMRVEKPKDQETTLQKIEQRLEKISEVIAKMEDDTTTTTHESGLSAGRKLYERIAAEEKVSNWMLSPSPSIAPPPPDPGSSKQQQTQLMEELRSKVSLVDEFTPSPRLMAFAKVENVTADAETGNSSSAESRSYDLPRVKTVVLPDGKILSVRRNSSSLTRSENSQSATTSEGDNYQETSGSSLVAPAIALEDLPAKVSAPDGLATPGQTHTHSRAAEGFGSFDTTHSPTFSKDPRKTHQESEGFPSGVQAKYFTSNSSVVEPIVRNGIRDLPSASPHEEPGNNRLGRSELYEDLRIPSPTTNNIRAIEEKERSLMGHQMDSDSDPFCSYQSYADVTTSSGVYSIREATRERRSESVCRSFDYYSHTKVRPYDDAESLPFLESTSPSRTTTPFLEYASPYRRKMSVIDEFPETLHRSSSEERPISAEPPPLPDIDAPQKESETMMYRRTITKANF
nr:Leucine-rich repeat and Protein phosphatase 2C domain containing protein [Haemonchus contortus]